MTGPLLWALRETEIGDAAQTFTRSATAAERADIAAALEILSCEALSVDFEIAPGADRRFYRLSGAIRADVTQACVVSLEPVPARHDLTVAVEFWPGGGGQPNAELDDGPDIEPVQNGILDIGRMVFEHVATALDPYPRKAGVEFDWRDPKADDPASHPFSALRRLKLEE